MAEHSGMWIIAQDSLLQAPSVATGSAATQGTATTGAPGAPAGAPARPSSPFGDSFMFFAFGLVGLMLFTSVLSSRKEKKRRTELMSTLKRHDRVLLTGGMIATVADVRDDEVIVKVDDATNTRIHFMKSAVQQVLKSAAGEPSAAESSAA